MSQAPAPLPGLGVLAFGTMLRPASTSDTEIYLLRISANTIIRYHALMKLSGFVFDRYDVMGSAMQFAKTHER